MILLLSSSNSATKIIPSSFPTLKSNEVLVYSAKYYDKSWTLTLYRFDTVTRSTVEIAQFNRTNYWNGILSGVVGIQFSEDRRVCYISTNIPNRSEYRCMIYYIDGNNGTIKVLVDNRMTDFRSSIDGKYMICEDDEFNKTSANGKKFLIYGPNGKGILMTIDWQNYDELGACCFGFRREGNRLKIVEYGEEGEVFIVGIIDTETWDIKKEYFTNGYPNYFKDKSFRDDVIETYKDTRINIGSK
jgi:hypothetical protein